jgi:hypothetical protein
MRLRNISRTRDLELYNIGQERLTVNQMGFESLSVKIRVQKGSDVKIWCCLKDTNILARRV